MADLYFEDFHPGDVKTFGGVTVERDAMVAFARAFDPQPFHLDEALARATPVGELTASGWYTAALQMRMVCDAWMLRAAALGSPGLDHMRWLRPVRAGDVLTIRETVTDTKVSRSRPGMGLVRFHLETMNGRGETVMRHAQWVMLARRGAEAGRGDAIEAPRRSPEPTGRPKVSETIPGGPNTRGHFDDLVIGRRETLGDHTLDAGAIIRFAHDFDPQPFHLDEDAARASVFGGLAASGWHTGALWMRALVTARAASSGLAAASERPRYGPSPGFTKLRWVKPVRPGDTISFATTLTDKRLSASRPGWGLAFSHNTGHDQHGDLVFSFEGSVFVAQAGSGGAFG